MDCQVGIGPNFFRKIKNDYTDWRFAFPRELMQNCCDAPRTSRVDVTVTHLDGAITVVVSNDGESMDRETITGKLLHLGESGKDFKGTVGGFGIAKSLLYFTHDSYRIQTGKWRVDGSGANYNLIEATPGYDGTESTIEFQGDEDLADRIVRNFKAWINMAQWPRIQFCVNGDRLFARLRKGTRRRSLEWGIVYTNKSYLNRLIVRVDGTPMFHRYVDAGDRCVVIELTDSTQLTSNRDNLVWDARCELDEFIRKLTVDKRSALREVTPYYLHYAGDRLAASLPELQQKMSDIVLAAYATVPQAAPEIPVVDSETGEVVEDVVRDVDVPDRIHYTDEPMPEHHVNRVRCNISHDFLVKNTTGMEIPLHFLPEGFSAYSNKLLKSWAALMLELHSLFGISDDFSVGFILDEEREAEFERGGDYGTVYFINPATVVYQKSSQSRSFSKRWKFNAAGKYALLAIAKHEFTHRWHGEHDEDYANKATDIDGPVMAALKRFHKCYRG